MHHAFLDSSTTAFLWSDGENPWGLPPELVGYERLLRQKMAGLDPASPAAQGRQTYQPSGTVRNVRIREY